MHGCASTTVVYVLYLLHHTCQMRLMTCIWSWHETLCVGIVHCLQKWKVYHMFQLAWMDGMMWHHISVSICTSSWWCKCDCNCAESSVCMHPWSLCIDMYVLTDTMISHFLYPYTCISIHIAQSITKKFDKKHALSVSLLHNPSHLEAINPVALGKTRAKQDECGEEGWVGQGWEDVTQHVMIQDDYMYGRWVFAAILICLRLQHHTSNGSAMSHTMSCHVMLLTPVHAFLSPVHLVSCVFNYMVMLPLQDKVLWQKHWWWQT